MKGAPLTGAGNTGGAHQRRWIGAEITPGRFFEGPNVLRRVAPFVIAGVLPFGLVPLADASYGDAQVLAAAALLG